MRGAGVILVAALLFAKARLAAADCTFDNVVLTEGQSAGLEIVYCYSRSTYVGFERICTDGEITVAVVEGRCEGVLSHCVQCGSPGEPGSAACRSSPNVPEDCNPSPEPTEAPRSCVVGDVAYADGESISRGGATCTGEAAYEGTESICESGLIVEVPYEDVCQGGEPFCVQCGLPGAQGAAVCLSVSDPSESCPDRTERSKEPTLAGRADPTPMATAYPQIIETVMTTARPTDAATAKPTRTSSASCSVGGVPVPDGATVDVSAQSCTSDSTFNGTQTVCRNGQVVQEPYEGTCKPPHPFCVQCDLLGREGAALCLAASEIPSSCDHEASVDKPSGSDCLVDGTLYQDGHIISVSGQTCTGEAAFIGSQTVCRDGQAVDEVYEGTCGDALPFCVQCGQPGGTGAALCSLGQAVPDGCEVAANPGLMPAPGCLAGGIEYRNNDRITFFGDTCNGNSAFKGRQTICRDGEIVEEQYEAACEGSTPYCVQCGPPGEEGAAICLSSSHVPDQCSHVGYVPADEGSCAVENITYKDGDRIGSVQNTCINDKAFNGAQAYCVGGKIIEQPYTGECPDHCVQCGPPGTWGAAICLPSKQTPDQCHVYRRACLVNGAIHLHGQAIETVADKCNGARSFAGTQSLCWDGQVVEAPYSGSCAASTPYCIQCRDPSTRGGALCQDSGVKPFYCPFRGGQVEWTIPPLVGSREQKSVVDTPAPGRCFLEEGVTFANGSVVGSFALQCRGSDGKEFGGMQTVCIDGQMIDFPYNDVCKSGYCVQCRDASTWAGAVAGCLEVPFTPAYCQLAQDSLTSLQSTGRDDSLGTRLTSALMKNIILVALIACLT